MPELPEVDTVVRGLQKEICGKKISKIDVLSEKIRYPIPSDLSIVGSDSIVEEVSRRAKYILIKLNNNYTIIIHLGMSGRIILGKDISLHDHFVIRMSNGSSLVYNDPRYFGFVDVIKTSDVLQYKPIAKLGIEPFSDLFIADYVYGISSKKSCNIKQFLLNQEIIAGIGNIYASEIMFKLGLNPNIKTKFIPFDTIEKMILVVREVLLKAIECGGTSIRDYQDVSGKDGSFQDMLYVYNREGLNCKVCSNKILRIAQSGRSTYYCEYCQK